jgi:LacI family transcriptional regulator
VRALLRRQIDGLIVVGSSTDPRPPLSLPVPVPVVYVYAPSARAEDISVVSDNVGAGRLAVDHMLHMGRRRIAHIGGDPTFVAARDRAAGVEAELAARDLPLAGSRVHFGTWSESWGRRATRLLAAEDPTIDAIICANDQIARGAMSALERSGADVPRDVAVMGFDNWEVLASDSDPPLTSIDMNLEGLGRRAAQLLREAIEGRPPTGTQTLECRLVARSSTAPAAAPR